MLCNLSRIPISMCHNPLYLTALQLLDFSSLDVDDSKLYEFYMSRNIKSLGDLFGVSFFAGYFIRSHISSLVTL